MISPQCSLLPTESQKEAKGETEQLIGWLVDRLVSYLYERLVLYRDPPDVLAPDPLLDPVVVLDTVVPSRLRSIQLIY